MTIVLILKISQRMKERIYMCICSELKSIKNDDKTNDREWRKSGLKGQPRLDGFCRSERKGLM